MPPGHRGLMIPAMDRPATVSDVLPPTQSALLQEWHKGLHIRHVAHSRAAARYHRRGRAMGVTVVILSTFVGTSIFAMAEGAPGAPWRLVAGGLSALAAILAAVQTSLSYPQLAEQHRAAARAYGNLRREVEVFLAGPGEEPQSAIDGFRQRWDELAAESPDLHEDQHAEARAATEAHVKPTGRSRDA